MSGILHEVEWRRCKTDPAYVAEKYWHIRHPERGSILLEMRVAQRETLEAWLNERQTITLKARQIGFSTLAAFTMWWITFFHDNRPVYALSKTEREAQKLLDKVKYGMDRLPEWMIDRGPQVLQRTMQKINFDNGSTIECLPATDPARGESAYMIFVDEWAHFEDAERAWAAIEPATDVGGRVHAISSANGVGNLFHKMVVGAMTRTNNFKFIFYSWRAVPERNDAWYETKRRNMLEWQLNQEYPSDVNSAFVRSGRPLFDLEILDKSPIELPDIGRLRPVSVRTAEFVLENDGALAIWKLPEATHSYVIGADVAEGMEHGDFSVAQVLDVSNGRLVAKWRGHIDPDLFGSDILWNLAYFYNNAFVGIETNNHGLTTNVALKNKGYSNLYYRHSYDERTARRTKKLGWLTTAKSKPLMIDELIRSLRFDATKDAEITVNDDGTLGELRTFVRDLNGKMHGSPYDDQVIALAIANQMRKHFFSREVRVELGPAPYTLDWYVAQADAEDRGSDEWVIRPLASVA